MQVTLINECANVSAKLTDVILGERSVTGLLQPAFDSSLRHRAAPDLRERVSLDTLGLQHFDVMVELCCIPTPALMGRVNFALVLNACELFSTGGGDSEAEDDRSARGVSG